MIVHRSYFVALWTSSRRSLVNLVVGDDFTKEVKRNQKVWESTLGVYPGDSALFINGLQANLDVYDVFTLLDNLKDDAKIMKGLHSMGLQVRDQPFILDWLYFPRYHR